MDPSTIKFHERQVCKGLEFRAVHQFSNLSHDSVWTSLGPYVQAWVGSAPIAHFHQPDLLQDGEAYRDAKRLKKEKNNSNKSNEQLDNLTPTPIEFSAIKEAQHFLESEDEGIADTEILMGLFHS